MAARARACSFTMPSSISSSTRSATPFFFTKEECVGDVEKIVRGDANTDVFAVLGLEGEVKEALWGGIWPENFC